MPLLVITHLVNKAIITITVSRSLRSIRRLLSGFHQALNIFGWVNQPYNAVYVVAKSTTLDVVEVSVPVEVSMPVALSEVSTRVNRLETCNRRERLSNST